MAHKTKLCKFCKKRHPVEDGVQINAGFFCSFREAAKWGVDQAEKKRLLDRAKAAKEKKASQKSLRTLNRETLGWQHDQTQKAFNKLIRLSELKWFSDKGLKPTCISCGNEQGNDQWCAGHLRTRGAQSELRYDRRNVFLQHNKNCNMHLSGDIEGTKNTHGYKQGLRNRFGDEEGNKIIEYCESNHEPVKWKWWELEELREGFAKEVKELERLNSLKLKLDEQ